MKKITQGKVAKLLNDSQIALNCGSNDGVEMNDTVRVMNRVEINDPDTKESLGSILVQILVMRVNFVMERASTAVVVQRVDSAGKIANPFFSPNPRVKLTADPKEVNPSHILILEGQVVVVERQEPKDEPF